MEILFQNRGVCMQNYAVFKNNLSFLSLGEKDNSDKKMFDNIDLEKVVECMLQQVKLIHMYPQ